MTGAVIIIFMAASSILCAYIASVKNRDAITWAFFGAIFGLFAVVAICAVPDLPAKEEAEVELPSPSAEKPEASLQDLGDRIKKMRDKHGM